MDQRDQAVRGHGRVRERTPVDHTDLRGAAAASHHRALVVLEGTAAEARAHAATLLQGASVWLAPPGTWDVDVRFLTGRRSRIVLGTDLDTLVIDLHATVDPDAIGATIGAVRAGGLVIVLLPPAGTPDASRASLVVTPFLERDVGDRFVRRLRSALERACEDGRAIGAPTGSAPARAGAAPALAGAVGARSPADGPAGERPPADGPRTADQAAAVAALVDLQPGVPVVLISDRGRGKSSALGLAAGQLLRSGEVDEIVITGPAAPAVEPVFARAREILGPDTPGLRWHPPRDLLRKPVPFLLVDEAASFPVPILERLLGTHLRIAFSTTVHGYEGTGRGFAVRFRHVLDHRAPGWREVRLTEPIRWAPNDPVEAFAFDALLMSAEAAPAAAIASATVASTTFVRFDRDELAADESLLRELFGLLVLAHYRTSPADLRRLLDSPNLSVSALLHEGRVAAAALIAAEGALSEEDAEAVLTGRFRPRGHMLPEVLATHLGCARGAELPTARVVRIAVHPALQGRGLGTHLMEHLVQAARDDGAVLLGSGFGSTTELIRFWRRSGLHPIRLGVRRGAASGVYSAIVVRALAPEAEELVRGLQARFVERFPHQLSDPHRDLDRGLAIELLRPPGDTSPRAAPAQPIPGLDGPPPDDLDLTPADFDDLLAIAFGPRIYDAAVGPVWKLVMRALTDPKYRAALVPESRELLIAKVIDKRGWHELTESLGFADLHGPMRAVREALVPIVLELGGEAAEYARDRFTGGTLLGPPDPAIRTAALRRLGFSEAVEPISDRRRARMRSVLEARQLDLQLVLDNIWDPHNAAAILRSADAFGVGAVDLVYTHEQFPRISDMAAGYTKRWALLNKHSSIEDCYASLRARGLRIIATGPAPGSVLYTEIDWTQPTALVIGHERDGCSQHALENADEIVIIPMIGFAQSLNVSVATAVLLAEIARQRRQAGMYDGAWSSWHDETINQWAVRDQMGVPWKPIWPPDVPSCEGDD